MAMARWCVRYFLFSSRRRHTRCALVTGVQTCALPILVGAAAFAAHDPLAKRVGAVVNMEARGTTGGVNMFQTSSPNGRDTAAIGRPLPFANSQTGRASCRERGCPYV